MAVTSVTSVHRPPPLYHQWRMTTVAEGVESVEQITALRRLGPRQRAVVVLRYWEDLTDTQIGAVGKAQLAQIIDKAL